MWKKWVAMVYGLGEEWGIGNKGHKRKEVSYKRREWGTWKAHVQGSKGTFINGRGNMGLGFQMAWGLILFTLSYTYLYIPALLRLRVLCDNYLYNLNFGHLLESIIYLLLHPIVIGKEG